jgi:hypothetical protein
VDGLGVDGPSNQFDLEGVPGPRRLGEPNDERFALDTPTALLTSGLPLLGEKAEALCVPAIGLPFPDRGDAA